MLRENQPRLRPITPQELQRLPETDITSCNYCIHKYYDVLRGYSRLSWKRIERSVQHKMRNEEGPFDPSYFEKMKRTYEGTGDYVVTHEVDGGTDYVRIQSIDK